MAKLSKDTEAYKNKLNYIKKYNKDNSKKITFLLNKKSEADIIEWLNNKRKATYIKQLIREDMEKNRQ
jgi:hypothetical protein